MRDVPYFWRPKEAFARLAAEARRIKKRFVSCVRLTPEGSDVQIKMHSDKIVDPPATVIWLVGLINRRSPDSD